MPYSTTQLEKEVRVYLGDIAEEKLPERIIFQFADLHDVNPYYTDSHPHLVWKTTLSCLDYLMAVSVTAEGNSKTSRKEKLGDWEGTITEDKSAITLIAGYKKLYDEYKDSPEKFGIVPATSTSGKTGSVVIQGANYPCLNIISSRLSKVRGTSIFNR